MQTGAPEMPPVRLRRLLGFESAAPLFAPALALALALALLPAVQVLHTDTDRTAALILLPAVWLAFRRPAPSAARPESVDGWLLAFAGVLALLSALLSLQPAANLVLTCAWLWVAAGGATAARLARSPAAPRLVMAGIAAGCVLGAVWARCLPVSGGAFPLYGHARIFGIHMLVGSAAVVALLIHPPRHRLGKAVVIAAAVIVWSGLLWSGGRGPLVGLAAGLAVWWWRGGARERTRLVIWTPVLLLAGLAVSHFFGTRAYNLGWGRTVASTVNASGFQGLSSERNLIWGQTLREIGPQPWLGQGADAYRFFQPMPVGDQPHNFILQWILAFGAPAALALMIVVARRTVRGLRAIDSTDTCSAWRRAAAAGFLAAVVSAMFDGGFYHAVSLIPVVVLAGIAGSVPAGATAVAASGRRVWPTLRAAGLTTAAAVVFLHAYLFFHLLAPPPASPHAAPARILRIFPSATYGFWRWMNVWTPSVPVEERLDWLAWAGRHSPQPAIFYYQAAGCHLERRDLPAAADSLSRAVATSHGHARRTYADLLRITEEAIAKKTAPRPQPSDAP